MPSRRNLASGVLACYCVCVSDLREWHKFRVGVCPFMGAYGFYIVERGAYLIIFDERSLLIVFWFFFVFPIIRA